MKILPELIAEAHDLATSRLDRGDSPLPDSLPVELTAERLVRAIQHTARSLDLGGVTAESLLVHAIADIWSGYVD